MTEIQVRTRASCGELLIELLEQRGVEILFGIPGVHTLEPYRGLASSKIRHVTPRHEQGAAFMADGYASVSGRPGVCLLITGPGLTNAATAVASAYHDSHRLLIVSSATDSRQAGRQRGTLHELPDQQRFMATIVGSSETVLKAEELPAALDRAFAVLQGPRPRPAHIGIPIDVLAQSAAELGAPTGPTGPAGPTRPDGPPAPDEDALKRAAALLADATEPIIVLGGGAIDAGAQALRLSALTGAPIATTINGKGAIPESHPAALGPTLTLEPIYGALQAADVVLAVGTEFSEVDYYYQEDIPRFQGALIRVDTDPDQLSSGRAPAVGLAGDAAQVLSQLLARLQADGPDLAVRAAARAQDLRSRLRWWPGASSYFGVLDAISRALPEDVIVAADSTQLAYVASSYLQVSRPRSYLCPAGYGTLGPALPMAIGAKLAAPQRPVVCLIGDGGLLFTIQELATAVQLGLPIAILVWQNCGYGEIRESMDRAGIPHIGTDASAQDYLKIAEGFGCHAVRASSIEQVCPAVRAALARNRPTLVEITAEPFT